MNERKVDRLGAIRIQSVAVDFEAVNVQRRTPVRQIAADLVNERGKPRWIEL